MLRAKPVFFGLILTLSLICAAATPPSFIPNGWEQSGEIRTFSSDNLYGYIDGGAELFLEFGFKDLNVYNLKQGKETMSADLYHMESAEAAMGIYLAKCSPETPVKGVKARNSGDTYQLGLVAGEYFLFINNFNGNKANLPAMVELANRFAAGHPSVPVTLLDDLPAHSVPGSVRLARGQYGLQPVYTLGDGDILSLNHRYFAVIVDVDSPDLGTYTRICVDYGAPERASAAFDSLQNNLDPYLNILQQKNHYLVFQDYNKAFGTVKVTDARMVIQVHLKNNPIRDNK